MKSYDGKTVNRRNYVQRQKAEKWRDESMENSNIKVSVIIPVYNKGRDLRDCLQSVLTQELDRYEVICIDDGSTDDSLMIVREYEKSNQNVRVICQEHSGAASARNLGIDMAGGEYLAFMDADDMLASCSVLKNLYDNAKCNNALICGGG